MRVDAENRLWLKRFHESHGRIPRVLHISNVANNAYNNAKLLNQAGLENHVIAHNDCYAMGCPEWEDADFDDEIADLWRPDWYRMNLKDFVRPRWFAQGEVKTCTEYLAALCQNNQEQLSELLDALSLQNCSAPYRRKENASLPDSCSTQELKKCRELDNYLAFLKSVASRSIRKIDALSGISFRDMILRLLNRVQFRRMQAVIQKTDEAASLQWPVDRQLIAEFSAQFPDRADQLSADDFLVYQVARIYYKRLLAFYDIVIGYAAEGFYPLMCGMPYFCYEHGTIRDIPYVNDTLGRICSITYRKARHVFVTNFDCLQSAENLSPGRFTLINHAYDEDQPLQVAHDWKRLRARLVESLDADLLIFHPTRHDWIEGKGYADKANDVLLRAFGRLRHAGIKVGLICCDWGHNVADSKTLISELAVQRHVHWRKPLGIVAYTRMCKAAHIVADQFKIGSFGGITFKALAASAPILTYLKRDMLLRRYPEVPPVLNCRTEEEIVSTVSHYCRNRAELMQIGKSGRRWMKTHHNKSDTVNAQLKEFGRLLDSARPLPPAG